MHRFIKLSCDITTSTIWAEDDATLRLWIWMMARADRHGFVDGTIPGIAIAARVSLEACERITAKFESPDRYSKNPANDGRRIEKVEGGWRLLNYDYYRDMQGGDPDWQKERHRKNQSAYRDRKKESVTGDVTGQAVTDDRKSVTVTTEAEAEAEANTKTPTSEVVPTIARQEPSGDDPPKPEPKVPSAPKIDPTDAIYQAYPRKVGPRKAREAIDRAIDRLMNDERKTGEKQSRIVAARWLFKTVTDYAKAPAGNRGSLTPHPATWFNQSRYLDDQNEWQRQEETHGDSKAASNARNLAATREVVQRLREAGSDSDGIGSLGTLLPTASGPQPGNAGALPRGVGGPEPRPVESRLHSGASGTERLLPPAGQVASFGRLPDRRPTF